MIKLVCIGLRKLYPEFNISFSKFSLSFRLFAARDSVLFHNAVSYKKFQDNISYLFLQYTVLYTS